MTPPQTTSLETITGGETLLVLAAHPGDESALCGGLIAQCCRRGRPPFVMVLGDGSLSHPRSVTHGPAALARLHERETREAAMRLGLPRDRLLMVGLFDGTVVDEGPVFEAVVRAVALVMWARDCNVVCAPALPGDPAREAAQRIAVATAERTGVGRLGYAAVAGWELDVSAQVAAKRAGIAAHATLLGETVADDPGGRRIDVEVGALERFAPR